MKIIGLTGGIGSGKTTVAHMFKKLGVPVYNSDIEAKGLMNSSKQLKEELVDLFGDLAYRNGSLNRSFIAEAVFNDKGLLKKLNNIVHPVVREHFTQWCKAQNHPYVIQESALIFENNTQDHYDIVILVTAPLEIRVKRILDRDNNTRNDIVARMNNQMLDEEKIPLADFVIENIKLEKTNEKVEQINQAILDFY